VPEESEKENEAVENRRRDLTGAPASRVDDGVRSKSRSGSASPEHEHEHGHERVDSKNSAKAPISRPIPTPTRSFSKLLRSTSRLGRRREDEKHSESEHKNKNDARTKSNHDSRRPFSLSRPATARVTSNPQIKIKGPGRARGTSGAVQMDETGVMLVDGVEFVNVISLKARVERVDSGLGLETAHR